MDSEKRREQSIIKTGLLAVFCGVMLGVFYGWNDLTWTNFLAGVVAGVGFTLTFFFTSIVCKLPRHGWFLYLHTAVAGAVGGLAWWSVSKTGVTYLVPVVMGTIAAPFVMWVETRKHDKKAA